MIACVASLGYMSVRSYGDSKVQRAAVEQCLTSLIQLTVRKGPLHIKDTPIGECVMFEWVFAGRGIAPAHLRPLRASESREVTSDNGAWTLPPRPEAAIGRDKFQGDIV